MSNNRPQNHRGIIPANQARGTIYTYQMMPQHIPGMFSQGAMNRMPVPQPMFYYNQQPQMTEEQMKMQLKEHNYHIQQQRLRSFNASTSQKRVNPDDFIQSMFGKPSNVRNNPVASSPKPDPEPISTSVAPKIPEIVQVQEIPTVNNQKNLEDMLLECTDLMRPGKAHSFPKLKENKRKSSTEIFTD
uniref:Uncharacterized protein n=1 Tax=Strigamia maritima TaxID=126957 RepID=T1IL42_STRMM